MNFQPHIKNTILQAILFAAAVFCGTAASAQIHIAFNGHVVTPDPGPKAITVTIVNAGDSTEMNIPAHGAFSALIAVADSAEIIVSCPGYMSKRIVLSIGNEDRLAYIEQVRFNVALERQPEERFLAYSGPVGKVVFGGSRNNGHQLVQIPQEKVEMAMSSVTAAR